MNFRLYLFLLLFPSIIFSQQTISGSVTDAKGNPIPGANVYIDGTYDGTTTDVEGKFTFETSETGNQVLVVSYLIYETSKIPIVVETYEPRVIKLRESVNALDAVVVTAGTFEAGDRARVSVLKPLDIVTTAGSAGNIIAALQTLPGTQTVGEDGRLFVRGGEADEAQTFIDGIRVAQPYGATTNNLPTRGRFSPFLFSGIAFSTGGYSAEYGEALSSVLLLNTIDEPDQDKTDLAFMTVGLGVGNTQKWEKNSLSFNMAYIDLSPYNAAIKQNIEWNRPFQSLSGETVFRQNLGDGLLKVYAAFDSSRFDLSQESINEPYSRRINLKNNNFYFNTSYKGELGSNWQIFTGGSYGYNSNDIDINADDVENEERAAHLKVKLRKQFTDRIKLSVGSDFFTTHFTETFNPEAEGGNFTTSYNANILAGYFEADISFSNSFAAKAGARLSHHGLLDETRISPRVSFAYKVSKRGQVSVAYGDFTQAPKPDYLKFSGFHQFESERASHYIANYQYSRERQTFRVEGYIKDYRNLVTFSSTGLFPSDYDNSGYGYARGVDLFWRDGKSVKYLEYWLSYSFIDTERKYRDFTERVTPSFVADHTLSLVTKYWIEDWKSQIGFANTFSSGRPFQDPNNPEFMSGLTRAYNSLSFNWAYLLTPQKILYFSVSNILNSPNVFGYEYSNSLSENGRFERRAIIPTADRFFFIGFFWTISQDKKSNQLENL